MVLFDFDQYYMGGCLSEVLAEKGHRTTYVTSADVVSAWCGNTHDQWYAHQRLVELGVTIVTGFFVTGFDGSSATLSGRNAPEHRELEAATLVVVGAREPNDGLYQALAARPEDLHAAGIRSLQKIGDCDVPGAVVHATYAGPPACPGVRRQRGANALRALEAECMMRRDKSQGAARGYRR